MNYETVPRDHKSGQKDTKARIKSWEKTGECTKTWNMLFIISFYMELNPLLTLPGIQTDLYPTFLFSTIPTTLLCPYVIHVDLIEPFCRFQLNLKRTACTINAKNLDSGYLSFQTAELPKW